MCLLSRFYAQAGTLFTQSDEVLFWRYLLGCSYTRPVVTVYYISTVHANMINLYLFELKSVVLFVGDQSYSHAGIHSVAMAKDQLD